MEWAEDMEWEVDMEWAWAMAAWDLAWEWAWTWTICSGPRGADVAASTRRGTLMMTECTALLDLITVSRCAWQAIMMVRNPSMWMSGAPSMNTLAMALAWAVQDLAMAWVQDPAMAWVQDLAMAWVVQDQAWVQAWDQDPRWNLWHGFRIWLWHGWFRIRHGFRHGTRIHDGTYGMGSGSGYGMGGSGSGMGSGMGPGSTMEPMAWVQDLAMAWVVQDQAWVQAWDQ